jgi:23S rRNA (pseudouridine1915-N3)-methyltransferase
MLQLKILTIGKTKERWLDEAVAEYEKRLKPHMSIQLVLAKDNEQFMALANQEKSVIALDVKGKQLSSEEFSKFLMHAFERGGSRLTLLIGGPEGLPTGLREDISRLSLSTMTLTHQMVRLLIVEQVYRAIEIAKGSPYHK